MRTAIIKEVQELSEHEIELLLNDDNFQNDVMEYVHEIVSSYVDDMLDYIKPYLYDYKITPCEYSYMKVFSSHEVDFIYAVGRLSNDYMLLDRDTFDILELAIGAANDYNNSEINSSDYYDALDYMSLYIKDLRNYLVNEFVSILEYHDSFSKVCKKTDYVYMYLENIQDKECLIDGDKVTLI